MQPFKPAHSKRYDIWVGGVKMVCDLKDKEGKVIAKDLPSHALPIHYMMTVPNQYDIDHLPDAIERRKMWLEEIRAIVRETGRITATDEASYPIVQRRDTLRVALRYLPGEIELMEERLQDALAVVAGIWGYVIYQKEEVL